MDTTSQTIFVTGGAGFIGSNLVHWLISETKYNVVNIDKLTYAGNLRSLSEVSSNPRYHFEQIDIANGKEVHALFQKYKPQSVIHLAAESHVDRSIVAPDEFIRTNIQGTFNLLNDALAHYKKLTTAERESFRFLHVSTDEVYGSLDFQSAAFTEASPYKPRSPYSASKAASDHLVRSWSDTYGLPILVTNCSNNYGKFQHPEKLIPVVILSCLAGKPIPIYGNGENVRDWISVDDHCRALLAVLQKGTLGESYNIGGENELRNIDLVKQICEILDELKPKPDRSSYANQITFVEDRPGHDLRYAIDNTKIRTELGWQPVDSFPNTLKDTIRWYIENPEWWPASN